MYELYWTLGAMLVVAVAATMRFIMTVKRHHTKLRFTPISEHGRQIDAPAYRHASS